MKKMIALVLTSLFAAAAYGSDTCNYALNQEDYWNQGNGTLSVNGADYECKDSYVASKDEVYTLCKNSKNSKVNFIVYFDGAEAGFQVTKKITFSGNPAPVVCKGHALTKENRCGWISNPTPANMYLTDADGLWIIGEQGGWQADGDITYPDDAKQFVETGIGNGSYGYFCGCIKATFDSEEGNVLKIYSSKAQDLSVCKADKKLPAKPAF